MDEGDDREEPKMLKRVETHVKHLISQPVFTNATKIPTGELCVPHAAPAGMENGLSVGSTQEKEPKKVKQSCLATTQGKVLLILNKKY